MADWGPPKPRRWAVYPFTDRELQVVALRVQGLPPREIAKRLGVSVGTVSCRLLAVRRKAGLDSMLRFEEWAAANGLDEWTPPEPPAPKVHKKRGRKKIRMGRIPS